MLNDVINSIVSIFKIFPLIFNLLYYLVTFIPNPIRDICLIFLPLHIMVFSWKLYKGGG